MFEKVIEYIYKQEFSVRVIQEFIYIVNCSLLTGVAGEDGGKWKLLFDKCDYSSVKGFALFSYDPSECESIA